MKGRIPAKGLAETISDRKYATDTEFERSSKTFTLDLVPAAPPSLRILDVGCGTGLNATRLREMGHKVFGIDISKVGMEKFLNKGFDGTQCDVLEGIPCEDGSFDLVFSSEIIEHVADGERFLAEIFRVLRPGGHLTLSTPNSAFWVYRIYALFGRPLTEVQHPGHIRFFSRKGLDYLIDQAGFKNITMSARHMYFVVAEKPVEWLTPLFGKLGMSREYRFKTATYVWHFSRFAKRASGFWADTLIVSAQKPL